MRLRKMTCASWHWHLPAGRRSQRRKTQRKDPADFPGMRKLGEVYLPANSDYSTGTSSYAANGIEMVNSFGSSRNWINSG